MHSCPMGNQEGGDLREVAEQAGHALAGKRGQQGEQTGEERRPGGEGGGEEVVEGKSSLGGKQEGKEGEKGEGEEGEDWAEGGAKVLKAANHHLKVAKKGGY